MQSLYAYSLDDEMSLADAQNLYRKRVDKSYDLFLFSLHVIMQICQFAEKDEKMRSEKYLPKAEDKEFKGVLTKNPLTQSIIRDPFLRKRVEDGKFEEWIDEDLLKNLYKEFSQEEDYQSYAVRGEWKEEEHIEMLHTLLRFLKKKESFNEILEDALPNWVDDKSLVVGALKKTFKTLPLEEGWLRDFYPDAEKVQEFGEELFIKVISKKEEVEDIIRPKLENWDISRLALVDTISLQMAIVEFLYFPTIPVKVTINEYVDISKRYSTDKSKEFINGLLDKIKNDLVERGKIVKEGRGLRQ
jgi:N utilization substance protein B